MVLVKIKETGKKLSDYMEVNENYINGAEFKELNSLGVIVNIARGLHVSVQLNCGMLLLRSARQLI